MPGVMEFFASVTHFAYFLQYLVKKNIKSLNNSQLFTGSAANDDGLHYNEHTRQSSYYINGHGQHTH